MPNSITEIQNDTEKGKAIKRKTNESLNEIYGEITRDEVTKARNDLVKSIADYDADTPIEVINNVTDSYKYQEEQLALATSTATVAKSVSKHVRESIKDRNQQYFKQRKPTVNKKIEKTIKPKLKITDIVNRDLVRSNSVTSIPISDVEMLSRSASLDSIVRFNRRDDNDDDAVVIEDQEMISRPSSAASIREQQQQQQPIKFVKPKRAVVVKPKQSTAAVAPATVVATVAQEISKRPTVKNRPLKEQRKKDLAVLDQFLKNVKSTIPKTIKSPPTISLSQSIANKKPPKKEKTKLVKSTTPLPALTPVQLKRQKEAAKADKKTKQQEAAVRFRAKSEDVEMPPPVVFGKRKKDDRLDSEAKTKKDN